MFFFKAIMDFFRTPKENTEEIHHGGEDCQKYVGERIGQSEYYARLNVYKWSSEENEFKYIIKIELEIFKLKFPYDKAIPLYGCELEKSIFKKSYDRCPDEAFNSLLGKAVQKAKKHFKSDIDNKGMIELLNEYDFYVHDQDLVISKL